MPDSIDNKNQGLRRQRSAIKYVMYVIIIAILVAEIGFAVSAWFSVQTVTGLIGGIVLIGTLTYMFERTAFGQLAEETFQQYRLLMSLLVVILVTLGGTITFSVLESNPRTFLLSMVLGMAVGMLLLSGVSDYRQ